MRSPKSAVFLSVCLTLLLANSASAHPGHDHSSGFAAGVAHPFSGIDHLLAMIAVGLLAAKMGGKAIWSLPTTFVGLMIGGGLLNVAGVPVPVVEQGIAASVLILGLLIAAARPVAFATIPLVGLFAVFHGYAHVAEMNSGHSPALYATGFAIATATLHGIGIAIALTTRRLTPASSLRWVGAGIAVCGVMIFLHVIPT